MNAWLHDTPPAIPSPLDPGAGNPNVNGHGNGTAFANPPPPPATIDPSMAFLQPQSQQSQPQSQSQSQSPVPSDTPQFTRMFNGTTPSPASRMSPGFHPPNSVVPSKRSRPDDGFLVSSPRQVPGGIPPTSVSRSQTPQHGAYPGYQPTVGGGPAVVGANGTSHFPPPAPGAAPGGPAAAFHPGFQQPASSTASPSPVPQEFDAQRVQTASPSPFPNAAVQPGQQPGQPPSDHGSRVATPQAPTSYPPGPPYPGQSQQNPGQNPAMMPGYAAHAQQMAARQQMYQMHMANQVRQQQQQQQPPPQMPGQPMSSQQQSQMAAMRHIQQQQVQQQQVQQQVAQQQAAQQQAQVAAQQQAQAQAQAMAKPTTPEGFLRVLQKFMIPRRLPLDPTPIVCGRPVVLMQLYATVIKLGGSQKVTNTNSWPVVAQQLQFPAMQYPTAAREIRDHYYRNLAAYEQAWLSTHQKPGEQPPPQQQMQMPIPPQGDMMSPVKPLNSHFDPQAQAQAQAQGYIQPPMQQPQAMNGYSTPSKPKLQQHSSLSHAESLSMSPNGQSIASPSVKEDGFAPSTYNFKQPIPAEYAPLTLPEPAFHGPIVIDEVFPLGEDILRLKPSAPRFHELGVIDIHALTMSLKSGLISETRLALDTLTTLSSEPAIHLSLENCDDLLPTLLDTATDHLELLAEHSPEVSDEIQLASYEELLRGCRQEIESLLDVPPFGSLEHSLDRAVDRLICITTILRNFSFSESNFPLLSAPSVIRFLALAIRYMGTRHLFLRTHQNTLDFMKDVLIFLSNLAHAVHLPGRDEALALLYFLLSFAPLTSAPTSDDEPLIFPAYQPSIHRYLPAAVDSLAKLLARDDPNRTLYKSIFSDPSVNVSTTSTHVSTNLLTRAFGLSISIIPEYTKGNVLPITETRKPFLMQGLLAAEVLSSLADASLARAWLGSSDGFAITLVHLAGLLSAERPRQPVPQHPHQHPHALSARQDDMQGYYTIVSRSLGILNRLGSKVRRANKEKRGGLDVGFNVLPKKENILGALVSRTIDPGTLKLLCEYEGLSG
ncbi:hypothetical protein MauCBS54593_002214 [Microsporum audouinii]